MEDQVRGLSEKDEEAYLRALKKRASRQVDDSPLDTNRLIKLAWQDRPARSSLPEEDAEKGKHFSRSDAIRLGHCLNFSYEAMQWFLLRVFSLQEGFLFTRSGDLMRFTASSAAKAGSGQRS